MFTDTDYDKLRQLMAQDPAVDTLINKLLASHQETISTISHEIRNPLTLVYSTLQLIETQHPEVTSFRHWESLHSDIEYMNHLLTELSSFNNSERISVKPINFYQFMKQLVLSFAASCTNTQIEFTSYLAPDLPTILADSLRLREVFLNLLKNAQEAVGSTGTIRLDAIRSDSSVIITIKDNGCGIPEEYLDDIFTPFVTHKPSGTGLGLAIVKRTITAHGGAIQLSSQPDSGTTFTVTLPIQTTTASQGTV